MVWYPLLTVAVTTVLYLIKDIAFALWARRKLYSEFRERAAGVAAPIRPALPPPLPRAAVNAPTFKLIVSTMLALAFAAVAAEKNLRPKEGGNPADHLPPWIKRVTWFGERADWSHDGKKLLFVEKTFGDVYEVELGMLLWGVSYGVCYGSGIGYALFACQAPARERLDQISQSGADAASGVTRS